MNKRHWVSVRAGEALSRRFVRELVVDSYRLVLEKLPRSVRPVDPETYGAELPAQRVGPGRAVFSKSAAVPMPPAELIMASSRLPSGRSHARASSRTTETAPEAP